MTTRCPPSQTPGGLGQRCWSVSGVTWPPNLEFRRWRSSGPSSLMYYRNFHEKISCALNAVGPPYNKVQYSIWYHMCCDSDKCSICVRLWTHKDNPYLSPNDKLVCLFCEYIGYKWLYSEEISLYVTYMYIYILIDKYIWNCLHPCVMSMTISSQFLPLSSISWLYIIVHVIPQGIRCISKVYMQAECC